MSWRLPSRWPIACCCASVNFILTVPKGQTCGIDGTEEYGTFPADGSEVRRIELPLNIAGFD